MADESELSTTAASDEDLMAAIAAREESAFHLFFRAHSPDVFALCLRILDDYRDAEDVLFEVFWELWSKADRYDASRGNPRTYLMLLARSRAIDRHRERSGLRERQIRSLTELRQRCDDMAARESPHRNVASNETRLLILEAVRSLDAAQREPLELAFFEGLSHREIAELLDSPLGTIKTRIRKGLAKLRCKLRELDEAHD
jgi:RNA polymerase sigma-70 factor (ECF subfamily)